MKKRGVLIILAVSVMSGMFSTLSNAYAAISAQERAALIAFYNSTNGDGWSENWGWKIPPLAEDGFAMPGTENTWYGVDCYPDNITVTGLWFYGNQLTGSIPPELGNLANLEWLDLGDNKLTGSIPPELGNLVNLRWLALDDNQLTGSIPPELGNLANLEELNLSNNQLTGLVPVKIMTLTSLVDNKSNFCNNYLYTENDTLRDFLNSKQQGGDWENCQNFKNLALFAGTFGSTSSDPNYNSPLDFDGDGDVDGLNLAEFAAGLE